jgi:DNA-binding transcriptional regulator YhcF (GntR family)
MKGPEIEIDDSTFELISALAAADDDPISLATILRIDPNEFRTFMIQTGRTEDRNAQQLLAAAQSLHRIKLKVRSQPSKNVIAAISAHLGKLIDSGVINRGALLPSASSLAHSLGVARNVVRGSYEYLISTGRIEEKQEGRRTAIGKPRLSIDTSRKGGSKKTQGAAKGPKQTIETIGLKSPKRGARKSLASRQKVSRSAKAAAKKK